MIRQRLFVRVLIVVTTVSSLLITGAAGRDQSALAATPPPVPRLAHAIELTRLRSAVSRTFLLPSGALTKRIYAQPINYRAANGAWRTIDNTLVPTNQHGYAFQNRANVYRVLLPRTLRSHVIRISKGANWLAFVPTRSYQRIRVDGSTATYAGRGQSIEYAATSTGVKESIQLSSHSAPNVYAYRLTLAPGLSLRAVSKRGIDVLDSRGHRIFQLSAPIMTDAAGRTSRALTLVAKQQNGIETLRLTANRRWLDAPARTYPVVIDPTTTANFPTDQSCTIVSNDGSSSCGQVNTLSVGQSSDAYESLLQFDLQGASDSEITSAQVHLYMMSAPYPGSTTVSAYQVTHSWDANNVNWTTYDGTNQWTPGGDIGSTRSAPTRSTAVVRAGRGRRGT
ncbi:MAG TPA: DNRLRE domain-containing protein [Chloroflexota bacterium]|nr:DNRLRE domain-containing protein [Chloroflexota bacterium]